MVRNNMTAELNGLLMTDRAAAHEHIREALDLPAYYGCNLDALFDILTERNNPVSITVLHAEEIHRSLGNYASALLKTLREAAEKNPGLTVTVL